MYTVILYKHKMKEEQKNFQKEDREHNLKTLPGILLVRLETADLCKEEYLHQNNSLTRLLLLIIATRFQSYFPMNSFQHCGKGASRRKYWIDRNHSHYMDRIHHDSK